MLVLLAQRNSLMVWTAIPAALSLGKRWSTVYCPIHAASAKEGGVGKTGGYQICFTQLVLTQGGAEIRVNNEQSFNTHSPTDRFFGRKLGITPTCVDKTGVFFIG